ncbi:MAG: hypothetical protein DRQ88_04390 [Epsilonproteobacteria bacterium]|nr:MAG: hypothetical protein DRQ89_10050 [Campylobacterota bacterium]RLA66997.1 MAG: hypothetical protein DRQ88_04390 [Campylobacterota bacterium]
MGHRKNQIPLIHFTSYFLIFGILFLQFPLNDSLPGNCDTWLTISLSNTYLNKLHSFLDGSFLGTSMFPISNIHSYGEASPGMALIFILFKLLVGNDIWAIYFLITLGYALNAIGANYFSQLFKKDPSINWLSGFFFAGSNFFLANLDDFPIFFYFFFCLSLYFLLKWKEVSHKKFLYYSAIVGGLQIYFSVYIFIFLAIAITILWIFEIKDFTHLFKYIGVFFLISLPMVLFYLHSHIFLDVVNPWADLEVITRGSLGFFDLFNPLPDNLIYPHQQKLFPQLGYWPFIRRHAFLGIIVIGFGIKGLFNSEIKKELKIIFLIGLILALGPYFKAYHFRIPSPLLLIYKTLPISSFLRVPLRAYSLCALSLSIMAGLEISKFLPRTFYKKLFAVSLFAGAFFIENIPFPLNKYYAKDLITWPEQKVKFKGTILNLPSDAGGRTLAEAGDRVFAYNRELIYMNWQTQHKQNILNGANGYYPKSRIEIQKYIDIVPNGASLGILSEIGVKYIIFHKNLVLNAKENLILERLTKSPYLKNFKNNKDISIFKLKSI